MSISSNEFKQILIEGLDLEDLTPGDINDTDPLFGEDGLGLDSVDSIELVLIIEKEYGVKIQNPALYDQIFSSVESLLQYINENK
ncbi:MAG: phosphopantetheine-binding protein [Arcobacteraceae bacterium]